MHAVRSACHQHARSGEKNVIADSIPVALIKAIALPTVLAFVEKLWEFWRWGEIAQPHRHSASFPVPSGFPLD
jgi:hypothetical protein